MVYNDNRVIKMLERICDKNVLMGFAKALADRGFKPGFDSMTADALVIWLEINGDGLACDLLSGKYKPLPAIGTNIAKKHGGYRRIVRLTALDTVIQQALLDAAFLPLSPSTAQKEWRIPSPPSSIRPPALTTSTTAC